LSLLRRDTESHSIGEKLTNIWANDLEQRIDYQRDFEELRQVVGFGKAFSMVYRYFSAHC
jgi:hypothetical protein